MKVVHLNTTINRSSAPYKLHLAMKKNGIDSKVIAMSSEPSLDVDIVRGNLIYKIKRRLYAIRRNAICKNLSLKSNMPIDILPVGMNLSKHPLIKEANVICIHWVNGDFLSPREIKKIVNTGKKVFVFCHDNYPFTGGCHVRVGCTGYMNHCHDCPQIGGKGAEKYIKKLLKEKKECHNHENVTIISPSSWMDSNVSNSNVLKECRHGIVPNVTDTEIFYPIKKNDNDYFTIICSVKTNENIPYNGMKYLWETLEKINRVFKKCHYDKTLRIRIFGTKDITSSNNIRFENIGYIDSDEKLRIVYCEADVFLVTSLEDSFNQTVAECMACGTPVVAFNNGGIADIIEHKNNGYMATIGDTDDLTEGINWIYNNNIENKLGVRAANSIVAKFASKEIIRKFKEYL